MPPTKHDRSVAAEAERRLEAACTAGGRVEEPIDVRREGCGSDRIYGCTPLGVLLARAGHQDEALEVLRAECTAGRGCSELWQLLAPDAARVTFRELCDGGASPACDHLAVQLELAGDFEAALPLYREPCERSALACGNLARLLERLGRAAEAAEVRDEAGARSSLACGL